MPATSRVSRFGFHAGWGAAVVLALGIAAFYLALTPWTTVWDRDEARFAQAAGEMESSGQWLVPTFNGSLRADKPILTYWLMGSSMRWLGRGAVAARFWSPIALAAAALATFAIGRRLFGRAGGLWAMAILATAPLSLAEGTAATADALLLAAVTAALAAFAAWLVPVAPPVQPPAAAQLPTAAWLPAGGASLWQLLALAAALTAALLAKGPVGLAVPVLAIGGTLAILARARRRPAAPGSAASADGSAGAGAVGDVGAVGVVAGVGSVGTMGAVGDVAGVGGAGTIGAVGDFDAMSGIGGFSAVGDFGRMGGMGGVAGVPAPGALRRYAVGATLAALVAVGGFCVWAIPANAATGGALARIGLGTHVVARSLAATGGHGRNALLAMVYYVLVLWVGFFPWTPLLPAAGCLLAGGRLGGVRGGALLGAGVVPLLVLFTLVATKLPHYVLPAWPPLSLAVAGVLAAESRRAWTARERAWLRRGVWLAVPPLALVLAALLAGAALPWLARTRPLPPALAALAAAPGVAAACAGLAAVVGLTSAAALRAQWRGSVRRAAGFCVAGSALAAAAAGALLAPAAESLKPVPRLARAIRAATPPDTPVAAWGFQEPSLVFELGRWPIEELAGADPATAVGRWTRRAGAGVLVLPRQALDRARAATHGALPVRVLAAASGLDVTHGRWIDLVAVERQAPPSPAPAGPP
jgi:4-amino-4-deoxy-L-arabinose transferase-like glycosyltransferase